MTNGHTIFDMHFPKNAIISSDMVVVSICENFFGKKTRTAFPSISTILISVYPGALKQTRAALSYRIAMFIIIINCSKNTRAALDASSCHKPTSYYSNISFLLQAIVIPVVIFDKVAVLPAPNLYIFCGAFSTGVNGLVIRIIFTKAFIHPIA